MNSPNFSYLPPTAIMVNSFIAIPLAIFLIFFIVAAPFIPGDGSKDIATSLMILFILILIHVGIIFYFKKQKNRTDWKINFVDGSILVYALLQLVGCARSLRSLYADYRPFDWNDLGWYLFDGSFYMAFFATLLFFYSGYLSVKYVYRVYRFLPA